MEGVGVGAGLPLGVIEGVIEEDGRVDGICDIDGIRFVEGLVLTLGKRLGDDDSEG